ncbi:structural maintenance of chromosomes protein 2-like [Harmonia axyridis]|uniref:structural maintenance of chromosomes protein 2-like n=1 Tax=Harmonia axyridis TaxID=115357 RepID=UPI001E278824|nr:structural maintenance of chromosomes protein 2-like [Harmonia axyridis]
METALWVSSGLIRSSAMSIVKFFVPKMIYGSARVARYFIPRRIVNLTSKCVEIVEIVTSFMTILEQVEALDHQLKVLKESSIDNEEEYAKAKLINNDLCSKISALEHQLKELEEKNDERILQEQIKTKEIVEKLEYEQQTLLKEADSRIFSCEQKNAQHTKELCMQKMIIEKIKEDRDKLLKEVQELNNELFSTSTKARKYEEQLEKVSKECEEKTQMIENIGTELDKLKIQNEQEIQQAYLELCSLKEKNFLLEESNEDLQTSLSSLSSRVTRLEALAEYRDLVYGQPF